MSSEPSGAVTGEADREQGLVPKLRFPEFRGTGEWTTRALSDFATLIDERVGARSFVPFSITSGVGLVSQQEKFGRSIAGQQLRNYFVIRDGDFAYNKSATKEYPQGFAVMFVNPEPGCVPSSIFCCFSVTDDAISKPYINYLLQGNLHGRWLSRFLTTGARANGSLNIDDADLIALPVPLPTGVLASDEQRKIVDCLSSLDALIVAETDRLAALKNHKKGLTQQLFPAEGETTPRLRFLEFRDAGAWTETVLRDALAEPATYGIVTAGEYHATGVRMVRGGDIKEGAINPELPLVSEEIHRQYKRTIIGGGDVLIALVGYPGECAVVPQELAGANISRAVGLLRPKAKLNPHFLAGYLNSDKGRRDVLAPSAGSAQLVVNLSALNGLKIMLPKHAEQSRVANLLSALDKLLLGQAKRMKALQAHKAGLMQQLFPAPHEAGA